MLDLNEKPFLMNEHLFSLEILEEESALEVKV